jgi:hypothetical protein
LVHLGNPLLENLWENLDRHQPRGSPRDTFVLITYLGYIRLEESIHEYCHEGYRECRC